MDVKHLGGGIRCGKPGRIQRHIQDIQGQNTDLAFYFKARLGLARIPNRIGTVEQPGRAPEIITDRLPPGLPTCGWGTIDREFVAADAARAGLPCPFAARPHADVHALCERVLGRDPGSRDTLRVEWALAPNPRRHRALDDALDVAQFGAGVRARARRTG